MKPVGIFMSVVVGLAVAWTLSMLATGCSSSPPQLTHPEVEKVAYAAELAECDHDMKVNDAGLDSGLACVHHYTDLYNTCFFDGGVQQ